MYVPSNCLTIIPIAGCAILIAANSIGGRAILVCFGSPRQPQGWKARGTMASKKTDTNAVLSSAHSRSYVSQSGLAAVLKSIQEHGLPKGLSRSSVKRARDAALPEDLWATCSAVMSDGSKLGIFLCHPVGLLKWMVAELDSFANFFVEKLEQHPCSETSPWSIALYSDEIVPGNALKPRNDRKLVAVYWTFTQFDAATGMEDLWSHVVAVRSSVVRSMEDGWSQLFKMACEAFFRQPLDLSAGVMLNVKGHGLRMLFAKIGRVIADEPALKGSWSTKGASGSLPCMLCRNVTLAQYDIARHDATGFFVSHVETDEAKIVFHTDGSLMALVHQLQGTFGTVSKAAFSRCEQALGLVHAPHGVLLCDAVMQRVIGGAITVTQYDFMHCYFVSGIWNTEAGYLLEAIKTVISAGDVSRFLATFKWPLHLDTRCVTGKRSLEKFVADGSEVKCSASEGLSLYPVLRLLLIEPFMNFI